MFDHWRKAAKIDTNIDSNGDGSSLEVPRTTDLWKADSAFIHWAMESKTQSEMHDWKLMTWRHKLTLTQLKTNSILKHNRQTGNDAQSRAYSSKPTLTVSFITWSSEMKQPMQPSKYSGCCLNSPQVLAYEQQERTIDRQLSWKLVNRSVEYYGFSIRLQKHCIRILKFMHTGT